MLARQIAVLARGVVMFTLLFFHVLGCTPVGAQVSGGTLSGVVTDPSGAVIQNTKISAKNTATGVVRAVTADGEGLYTIANLLPGNYEIAAAATGFSTAMQSAVTVTVGAQQTLNIRMQVGQETERVQVTAAAPLVELSLSSIVAVVDSTTIRELPLNGRSWSDLSTLQPSVNAIETQKDFSVGSGRGNRGFGAQVTISGARPQQNNYRLDGVSMNDYANGAPGSVLGGNLGVDAIEEFSVVTSNYSTEYGKTSGGVVNAITRSGTNEFHGTGYEFLRNSALDAKNYFDQGNIPPFKRNQFGAAAGGPIWKDHAFIFGDYEGIRQSKGVTSIATVLSPAARDGNLQSGAVTVDPAAQKYLTFWPLPNGAISGDTGIYTFAGQQVVNENFFTIRLDHKLSEKDSLFGTYFYDDAPFSAPDNLNQVLLGSQTTRHFVSLEETHTFNPTLVNTLRFGFNREDVANNQTVSATNPAAADTSYAAVPGRFAAPVSVGGISPFRGGLGGGSPWLYAWNSFQVYDDAFLTRGHHSVKFGFAAERMQVNMIAMSDADGGFSFGSIHDFLTNNPKKFLATLPGRLTPRGVRQTLFGGYVQDDWRWRPNVTFNIGLRYEMTTVPTEVQNKLSTLLQMTDAQVHLGNPFFLNPTTRNFEPRLGFAWDPFRNGKTAVRGSFGLYDVLPLPYEFTLLTTRSAPFYEGGSTSKLPQGAFYAGAMSLLGTNSLSQTYVEHDPHRNYVMQWNLNIQRQLAPNLTALIGYVGSHGVHQPFKSDDTNLVLPTLTSAGYLWPSPIGSGTPLNPNFGQIRTLLWEGSSVYHALEFGVTKRISHGLQFQGSFTWGKSIDTGSSTVAGDAFGNSITSPHWFALRQFRGLSDFNVSKTLVLAVTWQVPGFKSATGPSGWIANGWELSAIYKANTGVPFTPTFGTDGDLLGLNSSDTWAFPNRLGGAGCQSLVNPGNPKNYIKTQCFAVPTAPSQTFYDANCDPSLGTSPQCFNLGGNAGRNILTGPGLSSLDLSVIKNTHIRKFSESFNVQFRAEIFNLLNRANFAIPITPDNTDIFDSTGTPNGAAGLLTSTTTTAREIQLGIKVIW
jgi:hypothetical protein